MTTPIDYGKEFLENFFHVRDAAATLPYLADDVVWITPNEIRHLKSRKDILHFMQEEIDKDPRKYNVDIASIRSAPTSDQSSTVVYEINLIPQHTEKATNLRCSIAITRKTAADGQTAGATQSDYEITFLGMSRKYRRTDAEQIRGFIESLPSGVLVLTSLAGGEFQALYGNTYFAKRLGYDEDLFYDKIDENPFFMMPYEQQHQMLGFVKELAALKRPKPLAFKVTLETAKGKSLPFQAIINAAYKDGSRTIYYMLFNDLTAIEQEAARQHKKEIKAAMEEQKANDLALLEKTADKAQHTIDTARRQAKEASDALNALQKRAAAQLEAQQQASETALQAQREEHEAALAARQQESEQTLAAVRDELTTLQTAHDDLQQSAQARQDQLEQELASVKDAAAEAAAASKQALLQQQADLASKAAEELAAAEAAAKAQKDSLTAELEETRRNAAAERKALEQQIKELRSQIRDQQLGMASQETTRQTIRKEQEKSAERIETLLRGQTSRVASLLEVIPKAEDKAQAADSIQRAADAVNELPDMVHELLAIAAMDPTGREELPQETFSLTESLETIRSVMRPRCRERGTVLAIEIKRNVPDKVQGCKAGLQMVLLSLLENALESTTHGGRITLAVKSDPQIKGKAYYHFAISDTGSGLSEEQQRSLFDAGDGELSVTSKVLRRMGGNVNVTTQPGAGSVFDVAVQMEVIKD